MAERKKILIDFYGTIVESKERDKLWEEVLKSFKYFNINKSDFFKYWKETWFKSIIEEEKFIEKLREKFDIKNDQVTMLKRILDYKNLTLIDGRLNSLLNLIESNYEIHLVSDCGKDTREFIENSELDKILSKRFYSFKYGTTKDESLYKIVSEEVGSNCLMIGNDFKRDYEIPKKYGFRAYLITKLDRLEDIII